jgi:energy-coupling factor transporter ATP-binding protein EcfA2
MPLWIRQADLQRGKTLISFKGELNMTKGFKKEMAKESYSVEGKAESTSNEGTSATKQLQLVQPDKTDSPKNKESQTLKFLDMLSDPSNLFHTPEFEPVARINFPDHQETRLIRSKEFNLLLSHNIYKETGKYPSPKVLNNCKREFEGVALFESQQQELHVRLASVGKELYLDLGNSKWEQVKNTKDGWHIIPAEESPARFERTPGMKSLPKPIKGGSLKTLRDFLYNVSERDFILSVAWLVTALNPNIPTPILNIFGEQGSGKSTITAMLRDLIDPSTVPHRALPRNERELAISASKAQLLCFDNLSSLSVPMSDAFCRLVTGAGVIVRALFKDSTEKRFNNKRSIITNGISNIISRNDFADRSLIINLSPIPDEKRTPEKEIWEAWERERAGILGGLCDAVSTALGNLDNVELPPLVRWVVAAELALPWKKGAFLEAYKENCTSLVDMALEADPVGATVLEFIENRKEWSGTATDLLKSLNKIAYPELQRLKAWPKRSNVLSNNLMRVQTFLRKKGIEIERKHSGTRSITFRKIDIEEEIDGPSWNDKSPFVGENRPDQSDAKQDTSLELREVAESEIEGDYKGEPIEIIDKPWEEGEI